MQSKYKCSLFLLLSVVFSSAQAHDFWLSPNTFQTKLGAGKIPMKFLVGHAEDVNSFILNWDRIVALRAYSNNGYSDQLAGVISNNAITQGLSMISLDSEGTHVIGFESYHSYSSLDSEKFNDYANEEGLQLVLDERKRLQQEQQLGREIYSRKAKTLIQVGKSLTENATRPIGHMLEIVPLINPYGLGEKNVLPVKVMFRGKPLENALVVLSSISDFAYSEQASRTNLNGETSFKLQQEGNWKLNVVWGVPIFGNADAEFETYFSSLTFGYK